VCVRSPSRCTGDLQNQPGAWQSLVSGHAGLMVFVQHACVEGEGSGSSFSEHQGKPLECFYLAKREESRQDF